MNFRTRCGLAVLTIVVLSLNACGSPPERTRYVALGDSAVAGVGITNSPHGVCQRSDHNYPSLLAKTFDVDEFVDRSCPGATTANVLQPTVKTGTPVPAQLKAVTPDTDVVTISIGGNDQQVIPGLFKYCYIPPRNTSFACQTAVKQVPRLLETTEKNVVKVLKAIKKRAPDALVVMVSYLRLMPDSGSCATVPILPDDLKAAADVEGQLEAVMRDAAKDAEVKYVSMRERSEGHDACAPSDAAWVSALTALPGDGTQLHPRKQGMKAVADAVAPVLESRLAKGD